MAKSDINYSRPKGSNNIISENNSFNKTRANNSKSQGKNFKPRNSYSNTKSSYSKREQDSYLTSDVDSELESDVYLEKLETKKRIEREKNIKKRKDKDYDDTVKMKKSQSKPKKMKNIDWTRGYQNGLFDDDDYYDEYMR